MSKRRHYQPRHARKLKKPNIFLRFWNGLCAFCRRKSGKYLASFLISLVTEFLVVLFLLYGPINYFRELLITSAMTTFTHQYYARTFYSQETIDAVMAKHKVVEPNKQTDPGAIETVVQQDNSTEINVKKISGSGYTGFVMEISNPAWIRMGIPANFGTKGQKIPRLIESYHAVAGINAGGFADPAGWGNGGTPIGLVVVDGEILNGPEYPPYIDLVGFNEDNVLILGHYHIDELADLHIRAACEFGPFLIVDGEPAEISGNGGWGKAPRTAIGQRKDGTVIFVVIDGRSVTSVGATMKQLQQVLIDENCYNAANMDGGSSSVLYYEEEGGVMNHPSGSDADGMRFLATAWLVIDPETYDPPTDRPPYEQ